MTLADRIQEFLQRLTPLTRNCLLTELERLESCDGEMPGSAEILAKLRAEFRKDGSVAESRQHALALLLCAAGPAAGRRRSRACQFRPDTARLAGCDLGVDQPRSAADDGARLHQADRATDRLPTNQRKPAKVAATFQIKVVKYLENTLGSPDGAEQTRKKLANYTASRAAYADLTKMQSALRAARCAGKVQRGAAGLDREVRRRAGRQDSGIARCVRKEARRRRSLCAGVGGHAAQDSLATDPPRHQGRVQQERRGRRRHALCAHGLDGAGPSRRQPRGCCASRSGTTGSSSPRRS